MGWEQRLVACLTLLVGLATIAAPAYVAYDLAGRGIIPEKQLEVERTRPFSVTAVASMIASKVSFDMTVGNERYDNLVVTSATIRNVGRAPILPADYFQPLNLSVEKPWKIVTIDTQSGFGLSWKRLNDQTYSAAPILLNPGDDVSFTLYLTNTKFQKNAEQKELGHSLVNWTVRISNLRSISFAPDKIEMLADRKFDFLFDMRVVAAGAVIGTIFQAFYLYLMILSGLWPKTPWRLIGIVIATGIFASAVSAGIASYMVNDIGRINHWLNIPPILFHISFVVWLLLRWRQAQRGRSSLSG